MRKEDKSYSWQIEKDGVSFWCKYDHKSDMVEVSNMLFIPGQRCAKAGRSGYEIIAMLLASEIIREDKKL